MGKTGMTVVVAAWLMGSVVANTAWAAGKPADQSVLVYPAPFFADAHPATAADMVRRLPGFTAETGQAARGFAGTAGNVLVDGARPTAKTDDIFVILARIPAAAVARIEVIRGGTSGIDMQGLSIVANVVRRPGAARNLVLAASNTFIGDGGQAPGGVFEYHGESGGIRYDATLARTTQNWDDAPGTGYRLLQAPGGPAQYDGHQRRGIMKLGWQATGALAAPLWGGEWSSNLMLLTSNYSSSVLYDGYGGARFDTIGSKRQGEFGSRWRGDIGRFNLEALVLQRLNREDTSNTGAQPSGDSAFRGLNNSGETIGRITLRYAPWPELEMRGGGEAAYNFLDGRTSFVSNGVPTALPNASLSVNEKRGEAFVQANWRIASDWMLEGGLRLEFSTIADGNGLSRSSFYPKPRLLLSWTPDPDNQARLRVERSMGQLNFADFVASSNLAGFGVAAGNSNLRPDQRWQYELSAEHRFWGQGAVSVSILHEEITDLQDFVPAGGGLDAPGNIPSATRDRLSIIGTLPLDWLGLEKGLLRPKLIWWASNLADPVTGEMRRISNQRDRDISFEVTQDLDTLKSTWLLGIIPAGFNRTTWRIAQVNRVALHVPYIYASWTYKPSADWSILLQLDNALPYRFEYRQWLYGGPRGTGGAPTLQDSFTRTEPRLFVQLRKTWN